MRNTEISFSILRLWAYRHLQPIVRHGEHEWWCSAALKLLWHDYPWNDVRYFGVLAAEVLDTFQDVAADLGTHALHLGDIAQILASRAKQNASILMLLETLAREECERRLQRYQAGSLVSDMGGCRHFDMAIITGPGNLGFSLAAVLANLKPYFIVSDSPVKDSELLVALDQGAILADYMHQLQKQRASTCFDNGMVLDASKVVCTTHIPDIPRKRRILTIW